VAATAACSVDTPLTPAPPGGTASANADGSTLKVTAPGLVSPVNDTILNDARPTMVINAAAGQYANGAYTYEFRLMNDAGALVNSTVQGSTSWPYPSDLTFDTAYRWQARATLNGAVGPWSSTGRFVTAKAPLPRVTASSSEAEWHVWFDALKILRNVGPLASAAGLSAMEPDMIAVGVILEKASNGDVRGRIYLPTGSSSNLYSRAVDIGSFGRPWEWFYRGGGTVCEGICK
jgi:hypothetical protein